MKNAVKYLVEKVLMTWQGFAWTALIIIAALMWTGKLNLTEFKAGTFEIVLDKSVKEAGIINTAEFKNLKNLSEDDLRLFLIIGGEEGKYYLFKNRALSFQALQEQHRRLAENSLLEFVTT